jgi:hypothetical protein
MRRPVSKHAVAVNVILVLMVVVFQPLDAGVVVVETADLGEVLEMQMLGTAAKKKGMVVFGVGSHV